jgi:hypothetical protein
MQRIATWLLALPVPDPDLQCELIAWAAALYGWRTSVNSRANWIVASLAAAWVQPLGCEARHGLLRPRAHRLTLKGDPIGFSSAAIGRFRNRSCAGVQARAADRGSPSGTGARIMEDRHKWR